MNDLSLDNLKEQGLVPRNMQPRENVALLGVAAPGENHTQLQTEVALSLKPKKTGFLTEVMLVLLLLVISGVAHGTNMFHFPYYENDEGTYMSQAWSVATEGDLSPYTYWYDHAPLGWFFITLWTKLVGGFFVFGTAIDTGRVFMLVLHLLSTLLLYGITKRVSRGKILPGIVAGLIFSLSPLAIYFHRRVLLDNIMVFWVLLSFWLIIRPQLKLRHALLAALSFAFAVLTKETAVFFFPALAIAALVTLHSKIRALGWSLWLTVFGLVVSLYPAYALLKSEFFPDSWFGNTRHVSLLETLKFQASRGSDAHFWEKSSYFYQNVAEWIERDPFLIIGGLVALLLALSLSYKNKLFRLPLVFIFGMLLFLMHGGLVINFYILPLIPFLALSMGQVVDAVLEFTVKALNGFGIFSHARVAYALGILAIGAALGISLGIKNGGLYTQDATAPMRQAIAWTKENLEENSVLMVDNAIFVDLRESRFAGDPAFKHAEWFWKVEKDPTVYEENIGADWLNIDYVLLSHEMVRQTGEYQIDLTRRILPNTSLITGWSSGGAYINLDQYISTDGDWMRVYKVHSQKTFVLNSLWRADKVTNVQNYGQLVDENGNTTASLQGQAMLRSVLAGDRESFEGLWAWTSDHLTHRISDKLVSETWVSYPRGHVTDPESYLESNQDIALALILAGRTWGREDWTKTGSRMVNDLWEKFAVTVNDQTKLRFSTKWEGNNATVNPHVYGPGHYRVFAQVDSVHAWNTVADESYQTFQDAAATFGTSYQVDIKGVVVGTGTVSVNSSNVMSRVALDAQWFKKPVALDYLLGNRTMLENLASKDSWNEYNTTLFMALSVIDPAASEKLYAQATSLFFDRSEERWTLQFPWNNKHNLWLALSLNSRPAAVIRAATLDNGKLPNKVSIFFTRGIN